MKFFEWIFKGKNCTQDISKKADITKDVWEQLENGENPALLMSKKAQDEDFYGTSVIFDE